MVLTIILMLHKTLNSLTLIYALRSGFPLEKFETISVSKRIITITNWIKNQVKEMHELRVPLKIKEGRWKLSEEYYRLSIEQRIRKWPFSKSIVIDSGKVHQKILETTEWKIVGVQDLMVSKYQAITSAKEKTTFTFQKKKKKNHCLKRVTKARIVNNGTVWCYMLTDVMQSDIYNTI